MRISFFVAFIVLTLGLGTDSRGADGTGLWTNVYDGLASGDDAPRAITLEASGYVYVAGYTTTSVANGKDFATVKYAPSGSLVYTRTLNNSGASGDDVISAVTVDASTNIYVTGKSVGSGTGLDILTVKYSVVGTLQWQRRFNNSGNSDEIPNGMALDADGDVCIAGVSTPGGGNPQWLAVKYDPTGTLLWSKFYSGSVVGSSQANAIAIDAPESIYVTGYATGSKTNLDFTTIKYSATGTALWTNVYNGTSNGDDAAIAMALDPDGNVYITGYASGIGGSLDFATIKYSTGGTPLWTNIFNGAGNSDDKPVALVLDTNRNVYVTGTLIGSGGSSACATIKYSTSGTPLWTNYFNGVGNHGASASGLAVDASGDVFFAGTLLGGVSTNEFVTVKYSTAGLPVWTNLYSGGSAIAIAADAAGNAVVTGVASSNFVTIKYSAPPPPFYFVTTNGNFGKFTNKFVLNLIGPTGSNVVISASTNLQTWLPITTNSFTNSNLLITDSVSTNILTRFYRANLQ